MSSIGNSDRSLRKFLRARGIAPNVANMEMVGREVRRTQAQHERHVAIQKEVEKATGRPSLVDARGDVMARRKAAMKRKMESGS